MSDCEDVFNSVRLYRGYDKCFGEVYFYRSLMEV